MSDLHAVPETPEVEALHRRLAEYSLGGHWQPREKNPDLVSHLWPWSVIHSCLMESGEVIKLGGIDDAAKRRTVQLVNPALTNKKATTRTIQMSIQLVKPGERAECHRHTADALRFIVEGDGTGYTNVEGEQMLMEPGDLVLTPNWTWHDHLNAGRTQLGLARRAQCSPDEPPRRQLPRELRRRPGTADYQARRLRQATIRRDPPAHDQREQCRAALQLQMARHAAGVERNRRRGRARSRTTVSCSNTLTRSPADRPCRPSAAGCK